MPLTFVRQQTLAPNRLTLTLTQRIWKAAHRSHTAMEFLQHLEGQPSVQGMVRHAQEAFGTAPALPRSGAGAAIGAC